MQQLTQWLKSSEYTVIYTGAGMSTDSGLPDFRSENRGLWQKFNPDELANIDALYNNTKEFVDFYRYRINDVNEAEPHEGHRILAEWEQRGLVDGVITQNVDGFHSDAGSWKVYELHGTFRRFHCNKCGKAHERDAYAEGHVTCECGGTIRPDIVLFGETLPQEAFRAAEQMTNQADLFIVLGSSLSVSPANMFPALAKENGAKLVIINHEPTVMDYLADQVIHQRNIKDVLQEMDNELEA